MDTILGLLLFFGLIATIFWLFHEALWRANDMDGDEPGSKSHSSDRARRLGFNSRQIDETPDSISPNATARDHPHPGTTYSPNNDQQV